MTQDEIRIRTWAAKNGLAITDIQLLTLARYSELLKGWNQKLNLVSRKDEEGIWANHIPLSLAFLFKIDFPKGKRVLDLGTGGGLPGIPLAIMLPEVSFVLLDSIQKKIAAVQEMVASLQLQNVASVCSRAEELNKKPGYHFTFDAVIARSVSRLENLVSWSMPLLKQRTDKGFQAIAPGQKFPLDSPALITMKGGETEVEIARTTRRFPMVHISSLDLIFRGDETLQNSEKKLIIVENG